ncbi:SDH family Clp fold serine proteinase [Thermosulfuriphilus sp.]
MIKGLFWLFFIWLAIWPFVQQQALEKERLALMRQMEEARGSRVITLIHRQESLSILGIPVYHYIDIDDSEAILRAIRLTPEEMPIDLILHTPGGLVLAAEQIARALKEHPGKVTVFIPHYAMSGGTLIALAADEIVMDKNAVLGPVDPQFVSGRTEVVAAASILRVLKEKPLEKISDETLMMADQAEKALRQVKDFVYKLLKDKLPSEKASLLAQKLSQGTWTHDYPIFVSEARAMGLPVKTNVPQIVYELMALYPQARGAKPSVGYIPLPYKQEGSKTGGRT